MVFKAGQIWPASILIRIQALVLNPHYKLLKRSHCITDKGAAACGEVEAIGANRSYDAQGKERTAQVPRVNQHGLPQRGYIYHEPEVTDDGWETSSLRGEGVEQAKLQEMMLLVW